MRYLRREVLEAGKLEVLVVNQLCFPTVWEGSATPRHLGKSPLAAPRILEHSLYSNSRTRFFRTSRGFPS